MAIAATTERRQVEHLVAPLAVVVVALALFWPRGSGVGPDLAAARATWGESGSTSYVWEYSIGAGVDYPPVRVTVAGRSVVAAEFSEPAAAEDWLGVSPWEFAQTVDDLFTAIDTSLTDAATVEYDPGDGHPIRGRLNPEPAANGLSWGFTVYSLVPLEG